MRPIRVPFVLLAAASLAPAQNDVEFRELHRMIDPTELYFGNSLALGDVHGDGILDLLVASDNEDWFFRGDAFGGFLDASDDLPSLDQFTYEVELEDADADGDVDAFVMHSTGWLIYGNDGTGFFPGTVGGFGPAGTGSPDHLTLGDVDADGDPDALLGFHFGAAEFYRNAGGGNFAPEPFPIGKGGDVEASLLEDFDGDGDLDAYLGPASAQNELALNDGTGLFTDATANLPSDAHGGGGETDADAGDVDGDGDLDVVVGNPGSDPMALYLDPLTLVVQGTGTLDADGRHVEILPIPANPALVGDSVWWQAALGAGLELTNPELTILLGL